MSDKRKKDVIIVGDIGEGLLACSLFFLIYIQKYMERRGLLKYLVCGDTGGSN